MSERDVPVRVVINGQMVEDTASSLEEAAERAAEIVREMTGSADGD